MKNTIIKFICTQNKSYGIIIFVNYFKFIWFGSSVNKCIVYSFIFLC